MAALLVASSAHKKLSYDEFDNLAYGHRFLAQGPSAEMLGQRMPVLALNALPCLSAGCRQKDLNASEGDRLMVRMPTIVFTLALGALVWRFAGELFGPRAALLALLLYAFQPTFLGHGKQVTSDVQTALFTTTAVYCFWRALRAASWRWAAVAGLAVAGALASKFTSVLLVPILVVMAIAARSDGRRRIALLAVSLGVALFGLNAVYGFDGTLRSAGSHAWKSRSFSEHMPASLPLPIPATFARGLDYSRLLQEDPTIGRGNNYVLGELNRDGCWYAFPLMLLLKTPLATFALLALGASRVRREDLAALVAPPAIVIVFFSLLVDPQLGIRYILPAVPFIVVTASAAAADGARRHRAPWILAAWAAVSALSYHPHHIAYFNELIGRRVNAYRYLADSNLDWEDVDHFVAAYQRAHPETPLVVNPETPRAGYLLVGANELVGVLHPEKYRWLRENFRPVGHVAYSHLIFHVTPEDLGRLATAPE